MSMDFDSFFLKVSLERASAVVLSIWCLVGGCGCPILMMKVREGKESWALIYVEPILDSAANPMTFPIILKILLMAPIFGGSYELSLK